ncbi:hypothetical protein [Gaopeijia maritima]|uniref:Uncharacterized protein n=1 Tax=Gaopeijia maritima TaxID=3119007 RepID=A0ABU9E784_9BACT
MASHSDTVTLPAEARVFGHDATPAALEVIPRSTRWRTGRAARWFVGGAVLAPLVAILPPHAPWAVGAAAGGLAFGLRRLNERYTLIDLEGRCPRCGAALAHEGRTPLRVPHSVTCGSCSNAVALHPELPAAGAA